MVRIHLMNVMLILQVTESAGQDPVFETLQSSCWFKVIGADSVISSAARLHPAVTLVCWVF